MTFLKLVAFALALTAFWVTPAVAQEQENPSTPGQIPDPSTYQGSTVLQQQSDQSDQQYRQQQQQQSGQQYNSYGTPQTYQRYGGGGRYNQEAPSGYCISALERNPAFARLRGLVGIGHSREDPSYFAIDRRATATEKPVLMRWLAARKHCETLASGYSADVQEMNLRTSAITDKMIVALVEGRMTYGNFNYTRAHNNRVFSNYANSH